MHVRVISGRRPFPNAEKKRTDVRRRLPLLYFRERGGDAE